MVKAKFVNFRKESGPGMIGFLNQCPRRAGSVLSTGQRIRGSVGPEGVSRDTGLQAQPESSKEKDMCISGHGVRNQPKWAKEKIRRCVSLMKIENHPSNQTLW